MDDDEYDLYSKSVTENVRNHLSKSIPIFTKHDSKSNLLSPQSLSRSIAVLMNSLGKLQLPRFHCTIMDTGRSSSLEDKEEQNLK